MKETQFGNDFIKKKKKKNHYKNIYIKENAMGTEKRVVGTS